MTSLLSWIILLLLAVAVSLVVVVLFQKPLKAILTSNAYLRPASDFYLRVIKVGMVLATAATVVGEKPGDGENVMSSVWWILGRLDSLLWTSVVVLLVYVVCLTILFAVLGRYHDE